MGSVIQTLVSIKQLQDWTEAGWRIEEPVVQRDAYYRSDGRVCAVEIVLRRGGERRVIALRDEPEVARLLHVQGIGVLDVA